VRLSQGLGVKQAPYGGLGRIGDEVVVEGERGPEQGGAVTFWGVEKG